jgi:ectoine hydroxylase-related dioxygenase (phytanoyl-CoA dioxygenase family)
MRRLSEDQRAYSATFGFLVFRQLFSADEMDVISREAEEVLADGLGGQPFTGQKRHMVLGFVEQRPRLASLVEDDRIYDVVADLLGPDLVWITSDGNYYVGDTQWHPDAGGMLPSYHLIKVALYLDPVRKDSGCLRVIPGSHREPFHSALKPLQQHRGETPVYPFGATGEQIPAYPLESDPGDVVLFNQALWHASFGGGNRRRMFTLNFTAAPKTDEEVGLHRRLYEGHLRHQQSNPYRQLDHVYEPGFLAGGGPRRQGMVRQLAAWGFR